MITSLCFVLSGDFSSTVSCIEMFRLNCIGLHLEATLQEALSINLYSQFWETNAGFNSISNILEIGKNCGVGLCKLMFSSPFSRSLVISGLKMTTHFYDFSV